MKLSLDDILPGKNQGNGLHKTPFLILIIFTLIILLIIPLYSPLVNYSLFLSHSVSKPPSSYIYDEQASPGIPPLSSHTCDIFTGEWIRNPEAPYYTNRSCWAIHEHQNCMKYGRPDLDFMKWRWKPDGCDLPIFNPAQFLELVRDKSMAFVGDSVSRNQMQSLICLLSRVEYPIDVSDAKKDQGFTRWRYTTYNFTLASFWTPHLVKSDQADENGPSKTGIFNLYLDEPDEEWTTKIDEFSYVIISSGHWFFRSLVYRERGEIVGCNYCLWNNVKDLGMYYGYRKAFRTALKAIIGLKNYKGTTFLRTFAPSHFENGTWNQGGNCLRKVPFRSNETQLEAENLELYMTQVEEFRAAEREGRRRGMKFRLLDTTMASLLRPDGHPRRYGHWPEANVTLYNDCVHWCLPGPIDNWNDFLLHMLKMEGIRSAEERAQFGGRNFKIR